MGLKGTVKVRARPKCDPGFPFLERPTQPCLGHTLGHHWGVSAKPRTVLLRPLFSHPASVHPFTIYPCVHPSACPPSTYPPSPHPAIHSSCVPTHLSVSSFVCLRVSACLSNHPSICPSSCTADIQHDCSGPGSAGHWGCTERQVPGPKEVGFSGSVSSGLSHPLERRVQLSRSSLELYTATSQSAPCTWALCNRHSHKSGFSAAERELCV